MNTTINHTNPRVRNIILAIAGSFFLQFAVKAQTNTFPASGNVGIGTLNPSAELDVRGRIRLGCLQEFMSETSNTDRAIHFYSKGANTGVPQWAHTGGRIYSTNVNADLYGYGQGGGWDAQALVMEAGCNWENGGMEQAFRKWQLVLLGNGNVGIGTATPFQPLTVSGKEIAVDFTGHDGGRIEFYNGGNLGYRVRGLSGGGWRWQFVGGNNDEFFGVDFPTGDTTVRGSLSVSGTIRAREIIVDTDWADYVFEAGYALQSLDSVEQHIKAEKHLPGIPSAREVAGKGVSLGDMQTLLLAKIEELTLHQIELNKRVKALEEENAALKTKQE